MKSTQKANILNYLKKNKRGITKLEALKMFGVWNTGDLIFKLRNEGYAIGMEWEYKGNKRFARYYMVSK